MDGPNKTRRSGSSMTLSVISASIRSMVMSFGESFDFCDISVRVLVRSTNESRPSSADRRRMERGCKGIVGKSLVGVVGADSTCGM